MGDAELLRSRGLRVTAQRLAVLRAVAAQPHMTAESVAAAARAGVGAISLQAVYDALGALVDAGLVRRIQPAGSPALFEGRVDDNHHHAICRTCGQVTDVDCTVGSAPCLSPADGQGFLVDEAEVIYWGQCPACVATDRTAGSAPVGTGRQGASADSAAALADPAGSDGSHGQDRDQRAAGWRPR